MAITDVNVLLPAETDKFSLEVGAATPTTITEDGLRVVNAFGNKDNTLVLVFEASQAGNIVIKAGNAYPNATLGDSTVALTTTGVKVVRLQDKSRYENRDGSILIQKPASGGATATVLATAKRAGYLDATTANAIDTASRGTRFNDGRYPVA